jgi:pantoate kinase
MRAFAPGSVTAIFAPAETGDRSKGASVAVADGVVADVKPAAVSETAADQSTVAVNGEPTDFEPVELALESLEVNAAVDLTPEVPIGRGFGASGAATVATALAANEVFDLQHSREDLVEVAHRAEVEAGTGLGDVFVQNVGGLVVGGGGEPRRFDRDDAIEYDSFGPIATEEALADEELMATIAREGTAALDGLPTNPSLADLTEEAWTFAQATGLPTDEVREAVRAVEAAGGAASMAMIGETVFAVGVEDVLPNRTAVCSEGAHLRE